jgi:hypothetical protein
MRRRVLLILFALLAIAVLIDRTGLANSREAVGANDQYSLANAQLERQLELIASRGEVESEIEDLREAWMRIRPGVVTARTIELAPAALRERVRREILAAGVRDLLILSEEVLLDDSAADATGLVPMRIRVSFDIEDSEGLYRAIDRIERSDGLLARVADLTLRGGGLNEASQQVNATVSIDTVVMIGDDQ